MKRLIVCFLSLFLLSACGKGHNTGDEPAGVNELPHMTIRLIKGDSVNARTWTDKRVVLVLFQPDCDHCQREAKQIAENLDAFSDYELYFASTSPPAEAEQFARDYQLSGRDNVVFGVTTVDEILENFGPVQAPSLYIYSKGKLVQGLNGEVDISVIEKYL